MDPNNTTPGVGAPTGQTPNPTQDGATPVTPEPAQSNPASDVASAAMAGAEPVVATTDDNPIAPTTPAGDATEEPVSLAPSAGFEMPETATVSAAPNAAENGADAAAPTTPSEVTPDGAATDGTQDGAAPEEAKIQSVENQEPLVAAAPVPGSIGSAKSYADIRRAEAEKAAKVTAAQKNGGNAKNKIMITIIAIIGVALLGIGGFLLMGSGSSAANNQNNNNQNNNASYTGGVTSTLACKRNLATEEYTWVGAISGDQENIFDFVDDELDGLATNFSYTYTNKSLAEIAKNSLSSQYGVEDKSKDEEKKDDDSEANSEETEEPATTGTEQVTTTETTTGKKTATQMLHHDVSLEGTTVTHGMSVKSEDIKDWLASDAYSDVTYGAQKQSDTETPSTTTVTRDLEYYKGLQLGIGYTCSVLKGQ